MLDSNSEDYPMTILQALHDYFTPEKVQILADERYCLVAVFKEEIVGTGAIEDGELKSIFTLPDYQGMGIGTAIMHLIEVHAKQIDLKRIKVAGSLTALSFYEKIGYQKGESFLSKHAGTLTWMHKDL